MKQILIIMGLFIAINCLSSYSCYSQPCQDTSYIQIDVTLGHSSCEELSGCTFYVQIWLMSSPPRLLDEIQYTAGQNNYSLCAQAPVYYNICPKLVVVGYCAPYTLTQTPICTQWTTFPQWGNQTRDASIDPYCWTQ